jgi:hypothetical protein
MSLSNVYTAGLGNVGSYQVSGIPFATGSINAAEATKIEFPYVTRWVQIFNHGGSDHCRVGFSQTGVEGNNYFRISPETGNEASQNSGRLEIKVTELWLSGASGIDIVAGLTNIPVARINNLSGSGDIVGNNWSGSVGVG